MKRFLIAAALALAAGSAMAQPSEFLRGEELQAEVAKLCDEGCIVFSPAEVAALQAALIEKAAADAIRMYEQGKAQGLLMCRNAV